MVRIAKKKRKTRETDITMRLNLDGSGCWNGSTGIGFFDHMLDLFTKHGRFDLSVGIQGDLHVDGHHTVEDTGIVLGESFAQAVGNGAGINRYGHAVLPMEECLAEVAVDFCGRACLVYNTPPLSPAVGTFDTQLTKEFFAALARSARITLHINVKYGENTHHIIEGIYKCAARAFRQAVGFSSSDEIASTKGSLF